MCQKEIITIKEAAEYTSYAQPTIYKMCSKRQIPHYKRGNKLLFKISELDAWMLEYRIETVNEYCDKVEQREVAKQWRRC